MGGSAEEVSGAAGLAASAAVDLVVSADSVGASDVSAVVDSDVVSDSTVGMVGTGVITPTTTDAIFSISPGIRRRHRFVSAAIHRQVSEITPPAQSDRRGTRLPFLGPLWPGSRSIRKSERMRVEADIQSKDKGNVAADRAGRDPRPRPD